MTNLPSLPGAGGAAWYWHRVAPLLEEAGHKAIAVDLPAADDNAGLEDYADCVVKAIGKRKVVKDAEAHGHEQSSRMMKDPCRFKSWPRVPIHVVAGRDDRFFPVDFQRRIARERLGVDIVEIRGGHLVSLSNQGVGEGVDGSLAEPGRLEPHRPSARRQQEYSTYQAGVSGSAARTASLFTAGSASMNRSRQPSRFTRSPRCFTR